MNIYKELFLLKIILVHSFLFHLLLEKTRVNSIESTEIVLQFNLNIDFGCANLRKSYLNKRLISIKIEF